MIARTTPIGPEPTVSLEGSSGTVRIGDGDPMPVTGWTAHLAQSPLRAAYDGWNRRRGDLGIDLAEPGADRSVERVDFPMVDPKEMPEGMAGPAADRPSVTPGWLPLPLDDAVAMLIATGHTPHPAVVRGRECYWAAAIGLLLMPFGKGTLVGPRDWVIAASDQLDEDHYARWGEEDEP